MQLMQLQNGMLQVKVTGTYDGKTLTVPEAYLDRTDANFTYASGKISDVSAGALKVKDLYDVNSAQLTSIISFK